jgi:hypothetical protein
MSLEAALHGLTRVRVKSPGPTQGATHYTVFLRQPLEPRPFSVKECPHAWIAFMELTDVGLRSGFVNERLLLVGSIEAIPLDDLGIHPCGQSGGGNTKADTEIRLFGRVTVYAEQSGRIRWRRLKTLLRAKLLGAHVGDFACDLETFGSPTHKNQIMPILGDCPDVDVMASCLASDRRTRKPLKLGKRHIFPLPFPDGNFEIIKTVIETEAYQCLL